jgi:hypothetical protein
MVRLLSFVLAAFIFSCTIIEDGDITSQAELDDLQYASLEIKQETASGTSTLLATVTSEKEVNITVAAGKLTRTVYTDWPALGTNSKLKLKGGTTTAVRSYTSFLESGKPWTFYFFSAGTDSTIVELYSFRYNSSGRLSNVISRVPYVPGGPATSNDTLIYDNNGRLASITRKFPATGTTAAFTGFSYQNSDNAYKVNQFVFQGMNYQIPCQGSGCGSHWGGNYHVSPGSNPNSSNFPTGVMNLATFQREYLSMQDFNNINQSFCSGSGCSAWIDTFYLHPFMILKDNFDEGDDFLFVYMVDWWKPSTPQASTTNEKVTLSFNYDL